MFAVGLVAALGTCILFGIAAVLQAVGVREFPTIADHTVRELVAAALRSRALILVMAMHLVGGFLHLLSAVLLPLYLAQTIMAASVVVTAFYAANRLHEHLQRSDHVAMALTMVGLALLTFSAGRTGEHRIEMRFMWPMLAVMIGGSLIAWLLARSPSRLASLLLAVLAGVFYAITPFAARALGNPPFTWHNVLAILVIAVGSFTGFIFYSMALNRISTVAATAPLVLTETLAPAAVGLLFLHDTVRPGWWLGFAVGLAASIYGVITLSSHSPVDQLEQSAEVIA